uniref:Tiorf42 protein n=1 Tax=Agrobacterium tumefaciens TaxID=358 RepID=Q9R6L7_AGRTU|nr:tiorf42 [Agrobacterium tumefaciens]
MIIRGLQCRDVPCSQISHVAQASATPAEGLGAQFFHEQIGGQPRVTSVAVRKRMDGDQAMVETYCDLVRRKCLMLDPIPNVIEQHREFDRNSVGLDADIALRRSEAACPLPDLAEHASMQCTHEVFGQHPVDRHAPSSTRPGGALDDVLLFRLVEILPVGDPALKQALALLWLERCCVLGFLEEVGHLSDQRSRSESWSRM